MKCLQGIARKVGWKKRLVSILQKSLKEVSIKKTPKLGD
jgi:hypothetical protein